MEPLDLAVLQSLTIPPERAMLEGMAYPGGKAGSGVYQQIINLMPPHEVYVEPFLGGGAILCKKRPARLNIGIDLDRDVIHRHRSAPGCRIIHADALKFLASYPFRGDELVYCDPPYLLSTRRGSKRIYRHEFTTEQHRRLLAILLRLPALVMLSGYRSDLYASALSEWNSHEFTASTRRGPATETLWFNFQRPTTLHDYQFAGENYRQRERIKRKANRWADRLDRLPIIERHVILARLAQA